LKNGTGIGWRGVDAADDEVDELDDEDSPRADSDIDEASVRTDMSVADESRLSCSLLFASPLSTIGATATRALASKKGIGKVCIFSRQKCGEE